jgi:hypothetical protein
VGWLFVLLVGCGEGAPPLDELPLRDALQASPDVVAALSDGARGRLAARFALASAGDPGADTNIAPEGVSSPPAALVRSLDTQREQRSGDPLILGEIDAGVVRPLREAAHPVGEASLPALEGEAISATAAALEARGLAGDAGRSLSALLAASKAIRLQRVLGWPTGAVAIGDTIYVNAAWLIALAPGADGTGGSSGTAAEPAAPAAVAAAPPGAIAAAETTSSAAGADAGLATDAGSVPDADAGAGGSAGSTGDAGVVIVFPPSPSFDGGQTPSPSPPVSSDDSCAASLDACSACTASSDDGSDGCASNSDDSGCGSSDDDNGCDSSNDDSCQNSDDSGEQCSVSGRAVNRSPQPRQERHRRSGTLAVLAAPLAFLLKQRRA